MAQVAISLLLAGTAFLISNNRKKSDEGFSNINDDTSVIKSDDNSIYNSGQIESDNMINEEYDENTGKMKGGTTWSSTYLSDQLNTNNRMARPGGNNFVSSVSKTVNNVNMNQDVSQHQDKYYMNNSCSNNLDTETFFKKNSVFKNLAGKTIDTSTLNHNNMNHFYSGKSNGYLPNLDQNTVLDNYTGNGTYDIKKEEMSSFFKPEDNMQNVTGNKNSNDFYQSRVGNISHRHANTKPWEEIKVTPGVGMNYEESSNTGYNNYNNSRSEWLPKNVDELRTKNNPKKSYCLNDHMGPANNKIQNMGTLGKIVKKTPESFYVNNNNLGMIAGSTNKKNQNNNSNQMMKDLNRDTTSVEYYGVKGTDRNIYKKGLYMNSNKIQFTNNPVINETKSGILPDNKLNYGKDSYNVNNTNRSTSNNENYYGTITNQISNITQPLMNGLRHSKKTNIITKSHNKGNLTGTYKKPMLFDPTTHVQTTNREMYECKQGLNHLNVQKQDDSAYMVTRPVLIGTQRTSTNQSEMGPAGSTSSKGSKNYTAEYNQTNTNRLYANDVKSNGSMSIFNNKINMNTHSNEVCNNRQTPFYNPTTKDTLNPVEKLGTFTSLPQNYEENNTNNADLLKAFKNNPYTHSLSSAV